MAACTEAHTRWGSCRRSLAGCQGWRGGIHRAKRGNMQRRTEQSGVPGRALCALSFSFSVCLGSSSTSFCFSPVVVFFLLFRMCRVCSSHIWAKLSYTLTPSHCLRLSRSGEREAVCWRKRAARRKERGLECRARKQSTAVFLCLCSHSLPSVFLSSSRRSYLSFFFFFSLSLYLCGCHTEGAPVAQPPFSTYTHTHTYINRPLSQYIQRCRPRQHQKLFFSFSPIRLFFL